MKKIENKFLRKSAPERSARMVETIYGCKWSLTVYNLLANQINRPGEMVKSVEGLSTKVLNECLKRNVDFGTSGHRGPSSRYRADRSAQVFHRKTKTVERECRSSARAAGRRNSIRGRSADLVSA